MEATDAGSGEIVHASPYYQVTQPRTIRFFLPGRSDAVSIHTGSEFHLGQSPPHWFGQFANSATQVRIEPALTQNAALFLYQQADRCPYDALPYRLYHSGSEVASGQLPATGAFWDRVSPAQIPLSSSGAYSLEVTHDQYWIGGDPGHARVVAEFDTSLTDKNPPTVLALNVLHNGEMSSLLPPGAQSQVSLRVTDSGGLSEVSLFYREDSDWAALPLAKQGNDYTTQPPGFAEGARVSLKIVARDAAGNSLTYEVEPALAVKVPPPTPTPTNTPRPTASPTPSPTPPQTTVTLQQGSDGYEGCEDTYIYETAPDSNFCDLDRLRIGLERRTALLRFNLSSIPPGAAVIEATLQAYAVAWSGSPELTIDAFRILRSTDLCQATWNVAQTNEPWAIPGCDGPGSDRAIDAESRLSTSGAARWYSFDVTTLVQDWLDGTLDNNGVLLRPASPLPDGAVYLLSSAEDSDVAVRPRLVITYSTTQCVPTLVSPEPGALMDNGRTDGQDERVWDFDWSDCPGADAYHLYVIGPGATIPLVNNITTDTSYQSRSRGYIVHRFNWRWRVRARVDGVWGPWSEERFFDVEPENTDPPQAPTLTPTTTYTPSPTLTDTATPTATPIVSDPIVQVTTDVGYDGDPSVAQAADGTLWVFWESDRSGNRDIWHKTSDDRGATWSTASQLTSHSGADVDPALTVLNDGTLWVVWTSDRSGNDDLWYKTSDDGGATWSSAAQLTSDPGADWQPDVTQTSDGVLWVVWMSERASSSSDIWYKTSNDAGATWSEPSQLTNTCCPWMPGITESANGTLWIVWADAGVLYKTSSDGGASWSSGAFDVGGAGIPVSGPTAVQAVDGTLWLFWDRCTGDGRTWPSYHENQLLYLTSSDNGETWADESQWTRFVGTDRHADLAALADGSVAVAWESDRAGDSSYDICFGIVGQREDVNPPPSVSFVRHKPTPNPVGDDELLVLANAADETALSSFVLVWTRDGVPQADLLMHDDGGGDDGADDGLYGVWLGPLPVGTQITYQLRATDSDGNTVTTPASPRLVTWLEPFNKTADVVLVVDQGARETGWFQSYYTQALEDRGWGYDLWDVFLRGCPVPLAFLDYEATVWAAPTSEACLYDCYDYRGDSTAKRLADYLDAGGRLFITGQDIGETMAGLYWAQDFYDNYLHAAFVQADTDMDQLKGVSGDPIGASLTLSISGGDGADNQGSPDEIEAIPPAAAVLAYTPDASGATTNMPGNEASPLRRPSTATFEGGDAAHGLQQSSVHFSSTAGLRVDTGTYKAVYFAFGFEGINRRTDRAEVMSRILTWLGVPAAPPREGDTYIYRWAPDSNYCSENRLKVGYKQQYAALLRFDLSHIPANATVSYARLELWATGWDGSNMDVEVYRILRSNSLCQATWNQAQHGNPWASPGCDDTLTDRGASPEATKRTSGVNTPLAFDLTALVQDWVSGHLANNGLLLRGATWWSTSLFEFASMQHGDERVRPRLSVYYEVQGEPTATATHTLTPTAAETSTPTSTPTQSATPTRTPTQTVTPTVTEIPHETATPTLTPVPAEGTITLQQGLDGYSGCEDAYIYQYAPNANYCGQESLKVGYKQQYGTLLRFDTSPIPAGATVLEARLELYANGWGGSDMTVEAYRILQEWHHCQASWNLAQSGSLWGQPGCNEPGTDRADAPEDAVTTSSIRKWYTFEVTGLVQGWLDGSAANNGVLLRGASSWSTGHFYFASAQNGSGDLRPKLVVQYRIAGGSGIPSVAKRSEVVGAGHPTVISPLHLPVGISVSP